MKQFCTVLLLALCAVVAQAAEVQTEPAAKSTPREQSPPHEQAAPPGRSASAALRAARASNPALPPLATRFSAAHPAPEKTADTDARKTYSNGLVSGRVH